MASEVLAEKPVMGTGAVAGVADDGVTEMAHVAAELMAAAGSGMEPDQRIAGGRVSVDGEGEFDRGQPFEVGDGLVIRGRRLTGDASILDLLQRVIDCSGFVDIAADHREIGFSYLARLKQLGRRAGGFGIQCKEKNAGGGPVQAVDGVNPLTDPVPDHLESEAGIAGGDGAPVDEKTGGFMDGHEMVVAVEEFYLIIRFSIQRI